jgi:hypothetical protein
MIEHPIDQPNTMAGPTLSNDLIEAASRLMKTDAAGGTITATTTTYTTTTIIKHSNV